MWNTVLVLVAISALANPVSDAFAPTRPTLQRQPSLIPLWNRDSATAASQLSPRHSTALNLWIDPIVSSALLAGMGDEQPSLSSSLLLNNKDVWVFVAGLVPFGWATVEFWRRIAVGEPFGTSKDSIYIGKDNAPKDSRGRRVLDQGAFAAAYVLFGVAAAAIGLTLYSVVTSGEIPLDQLPSSAAIDM